MSSRGGYALITVLWLVVVLTTLVATGLSSVETSRLAAENRIHMIRARWAALGCLALTQTRQSAHGSFPEADSIALGSSVWCSVQDWRPAHRINPNVADSVGLATTLGEARAASLLDWIDADDEPRAAGGESDWYGRRGRRVPRNGLLQSPLEMQFVRGFEGYESQALDELFTALGDGTVAVNTAPAVVLRSVGALPESSVGRLLTMRRAGRRFRNAADLVSSLDLELSTREFRALADRLSFDELIATLRVRGFSNAGARVLEVDMEVDLSRVDERLPVQRMRLR